MTIDRHAFDRRFVATLLEEHAELLPIQLRNAEDDGEELSGVRRTACDIAAFQAAIDPAASRLVSALGLAAQAAAGMFQLATAPAGTEVPIQVGDGPPRPLAATGPDSTTHPLAWTTGFYAAIAAGDRASLQALATTPLDVMRASSTRTDSYAELHVATLQSIATARPLAETADLLDAAVKATAPEGLEIAAEDLVLYIVVPQLDVLYRILTRDAEALDARLERALELHREYWTELRNEPNAAAALLPLELAALVRLGRQRGVASHVRSTYLPAALVG